MKQSIKSRQKRIDGFHESYEKKEVINICLKGPFPSCKPGTCKRIIKERKKLNCKEGTTKIPDYEI